MAYQGLGRHDDALIAFSEGLALDPKQSSLLVGLIDAMLKSPYKGGQYNREGGEGGEGEEREGERRVGEERK